jgi:hypothetical protein
VDFNVLEECCFKVDRCSAPFFFYFSDVVGGFRLNQNEMPSEHCKQSKHAPLCFRCIAVVFPSPGLATLLVLLDRDHSLLY